MRTLTVKQGKKFEDKFPPGWHELTISRAKYGDFQDSKYIDVWFKGYPENLNMRVYEKIGKDGEEFAIGQLFRFANAGITGALDGTDGTTKVVKIDDSAEQMVGTKLNILFYKDGEYTRAYSSVAPTEFSNAMDTFTDNDVAYWKQKAETRFANYTPGNGVATSAGTPVETTTEETAELPF